MKKLKIMNLARSIIKQVDNLESVNIAGLEQKLNGAILWSIKDLL